MRTPHKQLFFLVIVAVALSACAPSSEKSLLADRLARTILPYQDFSELYSNLVIDGKPVNLKDTYEQYVNISAQELSERLSAQELQEAVAFYDSPVGQKLLEQGRESKANSVLGTPQDSVWICPAHKEIRLPSEGQCPICGRECERVGTRRAAP